ncbi:hypothetical protein [Chryseolinea lacunae]|uniref:PD-(D/E)XK nuclease superfamily protein n=1 Tax=Chryseolinea lacunae TaxID=2801331 RepID=A0ABS1KT34_9BACT|nr:hypothetical protein [Chryseolinea lacunae]MBL0742427.1 hypothetical protein [Chryseolinea lacunae]
MDVVEKLFDVFGAYYINGKIDRCPCGCISDEQEKKLYSKPLRELTSDDLRFYSRKAMTTWGDDRDYKHFLPRILELFYDEKPFGDIDADAIHNKLVYANFETWPEPEKQVVAEFLLADWSRFVNTTERGGMLDDIDFYSTYVDIHVLLLEWKYTQTKIAQQNLIDFIYYNGNDRKLSKNAGTHEALKAFICDKALVDYLEKSFFEYAEEDPALAERISVAMQVIEVMTQR